MKLLIFCTAAEKSDLVDTFGLSYERHTIMTTTNRLQDFDNVLAAFMSEERAVLILDIKVSAYGFSVPNDTIILFSRDCPDGALREQAAARNKRVDHA